MADINDLADLMESVDVQIKEQTGILRSILLLQTKEALTAQRRWEISRADRDVEPTQQTQTPQQTPTTTAPTPASDNTLAGLLGGLASLFGPATLSKFGLLAAGATALAGSIGVTIGIIRGQMTAIGTVFNAFGTFFKAFMPDFTGIFDDLKTNIRNTFLSITRFFTDIVDDLRIRAGAIRVSIAETIDNFINTIKSTFSTGSSSRFSNIISAIRSSLEVLISPFSTALTTIQELASPTGQPSRIAGIFSSITGWLGELGSVIGRISSVVGKIFAPIAIIMTAFDTIKGALDGYAEGGILGAFQGAIDGLFTSLITIPLDLVKNAIAWIAGKLGFDETAEILKEFSFTDLFKKITSSLFDTIEQMFAIIPSIDELQAKMFAALPEWLQDLIGEKERGSLPPESYVNPANEFGDGLSFRTGTNGFMDFGSGMRSTLHGVEAVVPRNTDAGQFLATNFDNDWKLKALETNANMSPRPIIINAPNNSQTNVSSRGGTAATVINAFGSGRSDLDFLSLPAGAQ